MAGGLIVLDKIKAYGFQAAALVLGVLLLVQTARLHSEHLEHQKLKTSIAQAGEAQATATLKGERLTAGKEAAHAQQTQENSDEFTTSQPVRDAVHRVDLARAERVRIDAERRAATNRAQAEGNAAACSHLADRLATFDRQLVEGVAVVGALRADLTRRDAEVVLLRRQVDIERELAAP